jgi:tetrahydromethanopterin S-methyltransferase subunit A
MIRLGSDAYQLELEQKSQILKYLLANFNDGRKKTFFSLAINLLDLSDSEKIMQQIKERITREMTVKENASVAVECFEAVAKEKGIILKMNKKPSKVK